MNTLAVVITSTDPSTQYYLVSETLGSDELFGSSEFSWWEPGHTPQDEAVEEVVTWIKENHPEAKVDWSV